MEHLRDKVIDELHEEGVPVRRDQIPKSFSIANDTLGFFNIAGLILIIIWGLITLTWYWVLIVSIGIPYLTPLFFGAILRGRDVSAKSPHLFSLICVGISVFVWIDWAINHFS